MVQFVYNNNSNQATHKSPFFASYGRHPTLKHNSHELKIYANRAQIQHSKITTLYEQLKQELAVVAACLSIQANKYRSYGPDFKKENSIYLCQKNVKTKRSSNKLDHTKLGPFKITKVIGSVIFKLKLPHTMHIRPVFYKSLLEIVLPGAILPEPVMLTKDTQEPKYEKEEILDHR